MSQERRNDGKDLEGVLVGPGELAVVEDGTTLLTVVGDGIAVCLWEPSRKVAGLAHFLESATRDPSRATARYGNVAIPHLVSLLRKWTPGISCEAQIYGGAFRDTDKTRGEENAATARMILDRLGIPIVSHDIGGSKGRKIVLDSRTGHVAVVKVHSLRETDWIE
jgi:chemotaxis protein CheD